MPDMRVEAIDGAFGARIEGVDPACPLEDRVADALREAMDEHHLLVFHLPSLDSDGQKRLASVFGPVLDESGKGDGWTLVSDRPDGVIRDGALLFHSDLAFTTEPLIAISLYALELPSSGTATHFADGARAAAHLPADLREKVAGREALHVFPLTDARGDRRFRVADLDPGAPRATHPVLWSHPRTGDVVLYVNQMQTDCLVGLSEADSEDLLAALWQHLYEPANVYSHHWQVGDLVVWDNIAVQHARDDVTIGTGRTLRRVPIGRFAVSLRPPPYAAGTAGDAPPTGAVVSGRR
jgi:taurine dioxygenase